MKKEIEKVVALVQVPSHIPANKRPHYLDYKNENILHITPCFLQSDGVYKDLRTGAETSDDRGVLDGEIDLFLSSYLSSTKA